MDEDAGRLNRASTARLIAVMAALLLFSEVVPLQITMVGVVLPKIGDAFPSSGNSTGWALNIMTLAGAASMPLVAKAADLYGKKRMLLIGGVLFLAGVVLCAVTTSWALFLVGRGLGAASYGMAAIVYGLIRDLMPRKWIPVAIAMAGTGFGASALLAPIASGLLTEHYGYHSIFWFLVVYMAVVTPLLVFAVPESPFRARGRIDFAGAALIGVGAGGVLVYLSEGSSWGWDSAFGLFCLIGGVALLGAFLWWESRTRHPMMELSLLRAPKVSMILAISAAAGFPIGVATYGITYIGETPKASTLEPGILAQAAAKAHVPVSALSPYLHFRGDIGYAEGFTVLQTAWHTLLFLTASALVFSPVGGLITKKAGARVVVIGAGVALLAASVLWWLYHNTWQEMAAAGVLYGVGFGFYYAAGPNLLVDAVPADRQAVASSMTAVFSSMLGAVGTAMIVPILASHTFQLVETVPGGKATVASIPQVYTSGAFADMFLFLGVPGAVLTVVLGIFLRTGRSAALGGAAEKPIEASAVATA
jgi:MFS family permease